VKHAGAKRYDFLTFQEVLQQDLKVMDATAIAFCKDNGIPILVLNIENEENLLKALAGIPVGTMVR
jgi:uridylate kinase